MRIDEALKETGKVQCEEKEFNLYAEIGAGEALIWRLKDDDTFLCHVELKAIVGYDWQPYHPVKEIRPENAGELWQQGDKCFFYLYSNPVDQFINQCGKQVGIPFVSHNDNGWKRLYPEVKEDLVFL